MPHLALSPRNELASWGSSRWVPAWRS